VHDRLSADPAGKSVHNRIADAEKLGQIEIAQHVDGPSFSEFLPSVTHANEWDAEASACAKIPQSITHIDSLLFISQIRANGRALPTSILFIRAQAPKPDGAPHR
jgi:hypothetical protein